MQPEVFDDPEMPLWGDRSDGQDCPGDPDGLGPVEDSTFQDSFMLGTSQDLDACASQEGSKRRMWDLPKLLHDNQLQDFLQRHGFDLGKSGSRAPGRRSLGSLGMAGRCGLDSNPDSFGDPVKQRPPRVPRSDHGAL